MQRQCCLHYLWHKLMLMPSPVLALLPSSQGLCSSLDCYRSLWFKHYEFGELKQIIQARLGDNNILEPSALSTVVSQVSLPHVSLSTYGLIMPLMSAGIVTTLLPG
jgi:hypothetical protein